MMFYTVCFLFSLDKTEVLLIRKDRTDFAGKYNGVGGKVKAGESFIKSALREIKEETGANVASTLEWLGALSLPWDCLCHDPEGCTLHFFGAVVSKKEVSQQVGETEELKWFPVDYVLDAPVLGDAWLAGEGDVQYFIRQALRKFEEVALDV